MIRWLRGVLGAAVLILLPLAGTAQGPPLGTPIPDRPLGTSIDDDAGPAAFLAHQLSFERVAGARDSTDSHLRAVFAERGLEYPASEIYLRVFKHERVLELWARGQDDAAFTRVKEYPVCALPGQLGPKQQMGDFQVPEGFYFIDDFNPRSSYHLSLRVSYPNLADRMRREAVALGGDIFVHGGCQTVGCVPIENRNIQEVYWLAVQSMDAGQRVIPIHIFPSRMDQRSMRWLERTFRPGPDLRAFWRNLAEGYSYFEETRQVPWITVASDGRYTVPARARLAAGDDSIPADAGGAPAAGDDAAAAGEPATGASAAPVGAPAGVAAPDARPAEVSRADSTASPAGPASSGTVGSGTAPADSADNGVLGTPAADPPPPADTAAAPAAPVAVPADTAAPPPGDTARAEPAADPLDPATLPRGPIRDAPPDTAAADTATGTPGGR